MIISAMGTDQCIQISFAEASETVNLCQLRIHSNTGVYNGH